MAVSKAAPMPAPAPAKEAPGAAKAKDAAPAGGEKSPATKKSGKKLLLIIAAAVIVLGAAGGAAYFLLLAPKAENAGAKGAEGAKSEEKEKKAESERPFFVEFEAFTTNLREPEKFLQIKLTFQVKTDKAAESLKDLGPIVRSAVIPVLSAQDSGELLTPEGKDKLSNDLVAAVNKSLTANAVSDQVQAVLITHMLIQ